MRLPRSLTRVLVLGALLAGAAAHAQAEITLRLNPELGAGYEVFTTMDTTTQQTMMGTESKTAQEVHSLQEMVFEQAEEEGAFDVVTTITAYTVDMLEDGTGLMGGEDGDASPMEAVADAMVGHAFNMTMLATGQVTSVSGMDEMVDRLFEAMGTEDVPEEMMGMLRDGMKAEFGDDAMKQMMSQAFLSFPKEPIEVGDSWSMTMSLLGMRLASEMTLGSVEGGVATVASEIVIEPDPERDPSFGAFSMSYERLEGAGTGSYRIDVASGMLIDADFTQDFEATMRVTIPGMPAEMAAQMPPIPVVSSSFAHMEAQKLD